MSKLTEDLKIKFSKMKVLLVDDSFSNLKHYRYILDDLSFLSDNIIMTSSGLGAVSKMLSLTDFPDLIIFNWETKIFGGEEFLEGTQRLKAKNNKNSHLIMIIDNKEKAKTYAEKIDVFVERPFTIDDLEEKIIQLFITK